MAPVSIENRVSPCKPLKNRLLGGVYPVQNGMKKFNRVTPIGNGANILDTLVAPSAATVFTEPKEGEIKISLRLQYLRNATDYLLKYKEKL